jgi:hypothetical protein
LEDDLFEEEPTDEEVSEYDEFNLEEALEPIKDIKKVLH